MLGLELVVSWLTGPDAVQVSAWPSGSAAGASGTLWRSWRNAVACGLAPSLPVLIAARVVQGVGAAVTMPTSMALVRQAFPDPARRTRAVGVWAMGGAVAAAAGPVLSGLLSLLVPDVCSPVRRCPP
ncbi:MFS transporter [Streptomyces atratus]|uniref:MFS transporter n=1 Tax=Streptomyces atratus TaxID=1893 RepID=UPI0033DA407F